MNLKIAAGLALSMSIAAFALVAKAEPNGRPPSPVKIPSGRPVGGIVISAKENFLVDAINYAKSGSLPNGKKPAVYATISIISLEPTKAASGKTPDRTNIWYSHGQLTTSGFPGAEILGGKFPLYGNFGDAPNPFTSGDKLTLGVNIERSGRTSLHYQVDGRNRLGKGPQVYQFNTNEAMVLSTTDSFVGGSGQNLIRITLTKGEVPTAGKVASIVKDAVAVAPVLKGMKVRVSATLDVTNADDGYGVMSKDNTVEVGGSLSFNDKIVWSQYPHQSYKKGGKITTNTILVDVLFDRPETWLMSVSGDVSDQDATNYDTMWATKTKVDLKTAIAAKPVGITTITLPGDRNDENAELYINVEKVGDIN